MQQWVVYSVFTVVAEIAANEMLKEYPQAVCIPREAVPPEARTWHDGRPLLFALALPEKLAAEFCRRVHNLEN